jgi:eukaryotic-like serine/threonine-protein kinase
MSTAVPADPFGLAGTILERKYRVDRVVAEGGFGIVYAGHHLALDLPVAIKALKRRPATSPEDWHDLLERFVQEAKTMARLRHPNIATILDTGVAELATGSVPWMVLEWLEGQTLQEALHARHGQGGRSPSEALQLLRPVFEAVAEAHDARIAHRDLKPSNVMLVPTRKGSTIARVLDFGIAKVMAGDDEQASSGRTTTEETFRAFSIGYAAPEQLAGTRTGPWTDVHALALILTEVLTDTSAYPQGDATTQHARVFDPHRPTPGRFGVDVGVWEPILARALAISPTDRFAHAGELLAALEKEIPRPAPVVIRTVNVRPTDDGTDGTMISESTRGPKRIGRFVVAAGASAVAIVAAIGIFVATRTPEQIPTPTATASPSGPTASTIASTPSTEMAIATASTTATGTTFATTSLAPPSTSSTPRPNPPMLQPKPPPLVASVTATTAPIAPTPVPSPSSTRPTYVPE